MKTQSDWKKSVVHLECAASSSDEGKRDIRSRGTAVFLKHENKRYLITARHVLFDETQVNDNTDDPIFRLIFRVSSFDEVVNNSSLNRNTEFLMNLGSGPSRSRRYSFSNEELDLAIICLDSSFPQGERFADELEDVGYIPINFSDIEDAPSSEGQEIYAIGYPSTSNIGELALQPSRQHWASSVVSLPVTVFGKVAMLHPMVDFFWGDLSIYPGNSGGPVISSDGKLVGIVSAQAVINANIYNQDGQQLPIASSMRVPIAKIIKAKHIRELLGEQITKNEFKFGV